MKKNLRNFALALVVASVCCFFVGCASTKAEHHEIKGMFTSGAAFAVGAIEVQSAPDGIEAAMIRYSEDTAWLSPSTKTHDVKILLTGTNAIQNAKAIVKDICNAFTVAAKNVGKLEMEEVEVK